MNKIVVNVIFHLNIRVIIMIYEWLAFIWNKVLKFKMVTLSKIKIGGNLLPI